VRRIGHGVELLSAVPASTAYLSILFDCAERLLSLYFGAGFWW
jgi:hypothetical protein